MSPRTSEKVSIDMPPTCIRLERPTSKDGTTKNSFMKSVSLVTLTAQNASEAVAIRYSRIRTKELYINSTATVVGEVLKLVASVLLLANEKRCVSSAFCTIWASIRGNFVETSKVALISLVYVIQNNCLFVAASNLDVATYQASYQLKILTTAVFSVLMLRKRLYVTQWIALFILAAGVALVKLAEITRSNTEVFKQMPDQDPLLGFSAVLVACCLSGFAGVYFEKVVKTTKASLWLRNVQMSILSIPLSLGVSYAYDWTALSSKGFFYGYDSFVWFTLLLKAGGGLVTALVIKYADNILKGFSAAIALVLGCVANVALFGIGLNCQFLIGTAMVIASVFLYNRRR